LEVNGSPSTTLGGIRLKATALPPSAFWFVLASTESAAVNLPGGSGEQICVGGPRLATGGARLAGPDGSGEVGYNFHDTPLNTVNAGETLHFQLWFRTPASTGQGVGLSNAVSLQFQ
jgi:hypothetical protein